jgi:hypothetical protein
MLKSNLYYSPAQAVKDMTFPGYEKQHQHKRGAGHHMNIWLAPSRFRAIKKAVHMATNPTSEGILLGKLLVTKILYHYILLKG